MFYIDDASNIYRHPVHYYYLHDPRSTDLLLHWCGKVGGVGVRVIVKGYAFSAFPSIAPGLNSDHHLF